MGTRTTEKPKPRLNNLDELFKLNEGESNQSVQTLSEPEAVSGTVQSQDTILATIPFSLMDDFQEHPFRLVTLFNNIDPFKRYGPCIVFQ